MSPRSESAAEIEPTVHKTRTLHFLFLRFTEDVNTRRRFSLCFVFFWMRWNYSDEVWNSTISLFKWLFRALPSPWWLHAYKLPIPLLHHGPPRDGISYGYKWDQVNRRVDPQQTLTLLWCHFIINNRTEEKKTGVNLFFYSNKSSKKSNIAGKNEQNITTFMPFLN